MTLDINVDRFKVCTVGCGADFQDINTNENSHQKDEVE